MINVSDLTFFTNEEGQKLEDRFKKTLKSVKYFYQLYKELLVFLLVAH